MLNRRSFISTAALGTGFLLSSCGGGTGKGSGGGASTAFTPLLPEKDWDIPDGELPDKAKDGDELRVALIGCGNRGAGAALDLLNAANGVRFTALADLFPDRLATTRKALKEKRNQEIADERCFTGFDSYQRVLETDVDMVILATPPAFRPLHFKAAVEAGKHAFLEKPAAVDPVGARTVIAASKAALAKGLCVITGTQRRHQRSYIEGYKQVQSGLIGDVRAVNIYWTTGKHWLKHKEKGWTDVEWMIRDWGNWTWLSGDHIVEQHVHNIDVINWFLHRKPVRCTGMGAHQRRETGDQYDMFAIDYVYEDGIHVNSLSRQIDGCSNNISEHIIGTKGIWSSSGVIRDLKGEVVWQFDKEKEKADYKQTNAFVLEHVNWVNHIRDGKPVSHAEATAVSTLTAIMGRISAYTGKDVKWEEVMSSDMNLMLPDISLRDLDMKQYAIAVPGKP